MARLSIVGFAAALTAPLMAAAGAGTILAIDNPTDAARLGEVLNGDSTRGCTQEAVNTVVLTLTHPAGMEVIEAQVLAGALTVVARGLEGTMPLNHPIGTCLRFNGNPDSPCDRAADICSSESARVALINCSFRELTMKVQSDVLFGRAVTDAICASPEVATILGACVANGVGDRLMIDLGFISRLIEKILNEMTWDQVEVLAEKLLGRLPDQICTRSDVRAQLAKCLATNILEAIRDDPNARALLQSLISTGMTGTAIADAVCASAEGTTRLAQCIGGAVLTAIMNNPGWLLFLRNLALAINGSTGLYVENGVLGFNYNAGLIVQSVCASPAQTQAMAACLQPYITSGGGGGGGGGPTGVPVQFGFVCPPDDGVGGGQSIITLYARVQDAAVTLANVTNMQVGGAGGSGAVIFTPTAVTTVFDGTKLVRFNSSSAFGSANSGPLVCTFSANGTTYTGMVSPNCMFGTGNLGG